MRYDGETHRETRGHLWQETRRKEHDLTVAASVDSPAGVDKHSNKYDAYSGNQHAQACSSSPSRLQDKLMSLRFYACCLTRPSCQPKKLSVGLGIKKIITFILVEMKEGSTCCKLPFKSPDKDEAEMQKHRQNSEPSCCSRV